jgi:hypothetical protein
MISKQKLPERINTLKPTTDKCKIIGNVNVVSTNNNTKNKSNSNQKTKLNTKLFKVMSACN